MKLTWLLMPLLIPVSFAHGTPIHMQIGNYAGVDANGQECSVFLGKDMGSEYMDFYWYVNSDGSYQAGTLSDPQPNSAGHIDGGRELMADGYDDGRPFFHDFYGAPIGTYVINSEYTMYTKGNVLTSFKFSTSPFEVSEIGDTTECKKLKYTGANRQ
jgi:hypothetical protein